MFMTHQKERAKLRAGDRDEVLSKEDILMTLDGRGMVDNLPFMPEMFQFCGKSFRVFKRAHKTCDPPNGLGGRRMESAVHLEDVRCDGQAHGGCQAGCLIFWKEVWLKELGPDKGPPDEARNASPAAGEVRGTKERCTEAALEAATRVPGEPASCDNPTYVCQSTWLSLATKPLPWWGPRQYWEAWTSGNARLSDILSAFLFFLYSHVADAGIGLGTGMRWIYDLFQKARGGTPYPWRTGKLPTGLSTPSSTLDLQPGEMVKVKSYPDILATLDENMRNRGMYFDGEMVPFTDKTFRVLTRVEKIIDEKTGKMMTLKSDAIILEGVACQGRYSKCRKFCSRGIYPFWREIWLERKSAENHRAA